MARATPICECYGVYKKKLELETYIIKMDLKELISVTHFRCAPITLPTLEDEVLGVENSKCLFCCEKCKGDE